MSNFHGATGAEMEGEYASLAPFLPQEDHFVITDAHFLASSALEAPAMASHEIFASPSTWQQRELLSLSDLGAICYEGTTMMPSNEMSGFVAGDSCCTVNSCNTAAMRAVGSLHPPFHAGNSSDQSSESSGLSNNGGGVLSLYFPLSTYFQVAQQLLAEFADQVLRDLPPVGGELRVPTSSTLASEGTRSGGGNVNDALRTELEKMLQTVEYKYSHCLDELQRASSAFRSNGGAGAAPFAQCAVTVLYSSVKEKIARRLAALEQEKTLESFKKHWTMQQQLKRRAGGEHLESWRPQRGLPEKSVAVLRSWMFENFLRPYPKDDEKEQLAAMSGLTRNQVANWFINARVRLWRPMVEEMCDELSKRSKKHHDDAGYDGLVESY